MTLPAANIFWRNITKFETIVARKAGDNLIYIAEDAVVNWGGQDALEACQFLKKHADSNKRDLDDWHIEYLRS